MYNQDKPHVVQKSNWQKLQRDGFVLKIIKTFLTLELSHNMQAGGERLSNSALNGYLP